jgi:hypothetical protein
MTIAKTDPHTHILALASCFEDFIGRSYMLDNVEHFHSITALSRYLNLFALNCQLPKESRDRMTPTDTDPRAASIIMAAGRGSRMKGL